MPGNWQILADGLSTTRVILISFADKRKYQKKIDRVSDYSVRLRQPAAAQRLLDLISEGKHYFERYPVQEECLWVGNQN